MHHLGQGWRLSRVGSTGARFQHVFLPDDPDEAHRALVSISRTGVRRQAATAGEYDQARLHDLVANEGFSHHPVHGAAPSTGWMASYDAPEGSGEAAVHHISEIGPQHIADHREAIAHHLSQPSSYQGGWHDTSTGDVYLDASRHFTDKGEARHFAADQSQKAIFHLDDFSEHFMDPQQDPLAMKDRDAWRQRYADTGDAPHPRWHEYSHRYPNTPEQDERFRLHPEARVKADTPYAGRPIGDFRSERYAERALTRGKP